MAEFHLVDFGHHDFMIDHLGKCRIFGKIGPIQYSSVLDVLIEHQAHARFSVWSYTAAGPLAC